MHLSYFQFQSPKTEYRVIQTHTGPVVILSLFTTFFFLVSVCFFIFVIVFYLVIFFSLFKLILCLSVVIFFHFAVAFCVRRLDKYLFLCYFSLFLQLCLFIAFLCICFAVFSFLVFPCCDFFVFCVLVFTVIFVSYCRLVFFPLFVVTFCIFLLPFLSFALHKQYKWWMYLEWRHPLVSEVVFLSLEMSIFSVAILV